MDEAFYIEGIAAVSPRSLSGSPLLAGGDVEDEGRGLDVLPAVVVRVVGRPVLPIALGEVHGHSFSSMLAET